MKLDKRGRKIRKINRLKMRFYDCRVWWLESETADFIRELTTDFFSAIGMVTFITVIALLLVALFEGA